MHRKHTTCAWSVGVRASIARAVDHKGQEQIYNIKCIVSFLLPGIGFVNCKVCTIAVMWSAESN